MSYFTWLYSDINDYTVVEHDNSLGVGWNRNIGTPAQAATYAPYTAWLAAPNTPAQSSTPDCAGNPNVLFAGASTVQMDGNTYYVGGTPTTNPQVAIDAAADALKVADAFTSSAQWVYFNQIVALVAADTAAGAPWSVVSQATFNLWRTWELSVISAFAAYVATPTAANMTALNTALAANPPMNM